LSGFSGQEHAADGEAVDVPDGLSPRQVKAMEALLQEPIVARAAAAGGVNERTLRRWLTEPAFRDAVFRARREAFGQAIWLTQRYAAVAVATLVKLLQETTVPPSAKVAAAGMILKFGREGMELDDLAERVAALERGNGAAKPAKVRPGRNGDGDDDEVQEDES
jgi:hypothetical protein